ncbi:MAG: hypothetical protein ACE5JO_06555 [Candidatus Binatia bacterium]
MDYATVSQLGRDIWVYAGPLLGVYVGYWLTSKVEKQRLEREKRGLVSALRWEVEAIIEIVGTIPDEDHRKMPDLVQQNYFSIFDSNADKLAWLPLQERKKLTSFYMKAKRQVDSQGTFHSLHREWGWGNASESQVEHLHREILEKRPDVLEEGRSLIDFLQKY